MLRYLSLDIICSSKLTVFLELSSRKTVRFSEQMMSVFSGEPPQIVTFSLPEDAAKKYFPTSKISAQEIRHQYFLICSNLTIMAHIMGLGHQSESWKITILS